MYATTTINKPSSQSQTHADVKPGQSLTSSSAKSTNTGYVGSDGHVHVGVTSTSSAGKGRGGKRR
jgi:hypothetical protein